LNIKQLKETIRDKLELVVYKLKEFKKSKFPPSDMKLSLLEKRVVWLSIIFNAIYGIIVGCIIFLSPLPESGKLIVVAGYAIIAPVTVYITWIMVSQRKLKNWSQDNNPLGGMVTYIVVFFLLGVCVITWALFWNTGIGVYWAAVAEHYYHYSKDEIGGTAILLIGSMAITPALVEEFLKSLPCILASFIVIQKVRTEQQKGKGALGNEYFGLLIGIFIGIAFEVFELIFYIIGTIVSEGTAGDIFFQVTVRNWAPIHILGGAIGGYAAGRAERLRFENGEENLPFKTELKNFIKRFTPFWCIPVLMHFLWNGSIVLILIVFLISETTAITLYIIANLIIIILLSFVAIVILLIFFEKANRSIQESTSYHTSGVYVLTGEGEYYPVMDIITENQETNAKFCTNCGSNLVEGQNFCKACGADVSLDTRKTNNFYIDRGFKYVRFFFYLTILITLIFTGFASLFFIILAESTLLFTFEMTIVMINFVVMILTTFILFRMRKHYSGKKHVWCWLIFIFNYIGMMGAFIFMGVGFLSAAYIFYLSGDMDLYSAGVVLGTVPFIMGIIMLIMLIIFIKKGGSQYVLHYQIEYEKLR